MNLLQFIFKHKLFSGQTLVLFFAFFIFSFDTSLANNSIFKKNNHFLFFDDDATVAFNKGYLGVQGTNTNQANDIKNLATLGISSISFSQISKDGKFSENTSQGNDIKGTLKFYLSSGVTLTFSGSLNWRETTGNIVEVFGFILDAGQTGTITYGAGLKYNIVGGTTKNTSTTIGLRAKDSKFTFIDGENRSGNAATTGLLNALNPQLQTEPVCSGTQVYRTIKTGSFVVDMGVMPQTVGNALKPYGLVYDLLRNYQVPIVWSINECKLKDGTDFSIGAISYKGGPFIIEADYRTDSVNARIAYWQKQGVVGITTTAPVSVPYATTLVKAPNWTLDKQNGKVAIPYFTNAGIPDAAYGGSVNTGWKDPAGLGSCDDLFIMPHADPVWATHGPLLDWNLAYKGGIWLGCSAGSHLEDMFDPANPSKQTNFLSEKTATASGIGPYYQNALIVADQHNDGVPPYSYDASMQNDPIMQFMGILDNAVTSGAETIYIPLAPGWRSTTKVGIYQSNNTEKIDAAVNHRAAIIAWGYGFGDTARGKVFIEASHQFNSGSNSWGSSSGSGGGSSSGGGSYQGHYVDEDKRIKTFDNNNGGGNNGGGSSSSSSSSTGTPSPEQVAAQRVFFNFSFTAAVGKDIVPKISGLPSNAQVLYSGQTLPLSVSVPAGVNINSYSVKWSSSIGGTFSPNANSPNATFTAPSSTGTCQLSVTITDACGRVYFDSKPLDIQCQMTVSPKINDVCYSTMPNGGSIVLDITNGAGPFVWKYKKTGATDSVSGTGTTITSLSAGTYGVTVKGSNGVGCVSTFNATLVNLNSFTVATNSTSNLSTYQSNDGAASITVSGSNPTYTYLWSNGATTQNLSSIAAGTYSVTVTDSKGCKANLSSNIIITQPPSMVVTPTITNVDCNGNNSGAISIAVTGGSTPYTYAWNDGVSTQNRTNLKAGTYTVTVTDANGASKATGISITQPNAILSVSEAHTNLNCSNSAATASITLTVAGGTSAYTYAWTKTGTGAYSASTQNINSLSAGTYNVNVTDSKGCAATKSVEITKPNALTISTSVVKPTCAPATDGTITLTITGGTSSYTYDWGGGVVDKDRGLLGAGTYSVTVTDTKGCTATATTVLTYQNPSPVTPSNLKH